MRKNASKILAGTAVLVLCLASAAQAEVGDSYFKRGNACYKDGRWDEAIGEYQQALKINPRHLAAMYNLGLAYQSKKEFSPAIETFQRVKEVDKQFIPAYIGLGLVYAQKGRYKDAAYEYSQAIQMEPKNLVAHLNLAAVFAKEKKYDAAIRAARKGLAIAPASPHLHLLIANVCFLNQRYRQAQVEYKKALKSQPQTPFARMMLAESLAHMGLFDEALAQMQIIKEMDANIPDVPRSLGRIYVLQFKAKGKGWQEAVDQLRAAASRSVDDVEIYRELGDVLALRQQYTEAHKWYRRVLDSPKASTEDRKAVEAAMEQWPKEKSHENIQPKL